MSDLNKNFHNRGELVEVIGDLSRAILDGKTSICTDKVCRRALEQLRKYRNLLDAIYKANGVNDEDAG